MGRFQRVVPLPSVMIRQCTCVLARSCLPNPLPHLLHLHPKLPPLRRPTHLTVTREATSRSTEVMGRIRPTRRAPASTPAPPTTPPHPKLLRRHTTPTLNTAPRLKRSTMLDGTRTRGVQRPSRLHRQATTRTTMAPRSSHRLSVPWRTQSWPLPSRLSLHTRLRHGQGRRAPHTLLRFRRICERRSARRRRLGPHLR